MNNQIRAMSSRQAEDRESGDLHCSILVMLKVDGYNWQSGNFCLNWRPSDDSGSVTSFHIGAANANDFSDEVKLDLLTQAFTMMPEDIRDRFELIPDSLHPNNNQSPALLVRKIEVK